MELTNTINNDIELNNKQKSFFNSNLGKIVNTAIDVGLRSILPDMIENQVIDIKNALMENGINEGINVAVDKLVDFAKSAKGIVTGNFENLEQVRTAVGSGGIVDTVSNLIDKALNKVYKKGYINYTVNNLIKSGKNVLLNNVTNNIKTEMNNQQDYFKILDNYIEKWKNGYKNHDFNEMEKTYKKIDNLSEKIVPFENTINEIKYVKNMQEILKNNGHNFNLTDAEIELIKNI